MKSFFRTLSIVAIVSATFLSIIYIFKRNAVTKGMNAQFISSQSPATQLLDRSFEDKSPKKIVIENFKLIDQSCLPFELKDLNNYVKIVYFGFTSCPKICPEILNKLSILVDNLNKYRSGRKFKVLFITVDPKRDTCNVLLDFLINLSSDIVGLTGTEDQIKQITKAFGVFYGPNIDKATLEEYGDINHTSLIYVLSETNEYMNVFHRDSKNIENTLLHPR